MELWSCPTAEEWDRFLLGPATGSNSTLHEHLAQCPYCRLVVEERRRELQEIGEAWARSGGSPVVYLRAWRDRSAEGEMPIRLAAKGQSERVTPESMTLLSPDQKLLMRAVRDRHTRETWLYLLANDPTMVKNVLVKPFGRDDEYVTDAEGRVNIGQVDWPDEDACTAQVRLPMATFTLTPSHEVASDRASTVLNSPDGDQIRVTLSDSGRNKRLQIEILKLGRLLAGVPLKVAVREGKSSGILMVNSEPPEPVALGDLTALEPIEIFVFQ